MIPGVPPRYWMHLTLAVFALVFALAAPVARADSQEWRDASPSLEVAAAIDPHPRITHLSATGKPNPLFQDPAHDRTGIRFLALEMTGGKQRGIAFDAPGQWIERHATNAIMELTNPDAALTLRVRMELADERVAFQCTLTSKQAGRKLAVWAIASVPNQGWIVLPQSRGIEGGGWISERINAFFGSGFDDPSLVLGREAFALDLAAWPGAKPLKYGTRAHAGWIAGVRPDLENLFLVRFPYATGDSYPDDDCNITAYIGGTPSKLPYSEIEWMSPWQTVEVGTPITWDFSVASLPFDTLDPGQKPTPDSLIHAIRDPKLHHDIETAATSPKHASWRLAASGPLTKDRFDRATQFFSPVDRPIAKAPLWFNSPVRSPAGLQWYPDTLVEVVGETIPPWTPQGRRWNIRFSPPSTHPENGSALLSEGDAAAGFAISLAGKEVRALLWSGPNDRCEVVLPLEADGPHDITVELTPASLSLAADGKAPILAPLTFAIPTPPQRMGIGRLSGWPKPHHQGPPAHFQGAFQEIAITPLH